MNESEWQTRKQRIDAKLHSLDPAWQIVRWREGLDLSTLTSHAVEELPTANGPADYGLFVNGALLGIIEAKKVTVNPQNVLEQAKRYAAGVFQGTGNWHGLKVPFLFATNGEIIWFLDVRGDKAASRQIADFHTAPALDALFAFNPKPAHDWLEGLFALADQLEVRLAKAQSRIRGITPSLLAHAFAGKLVAQDPTDEPAEGLLERIRGKQQCRKAGRNDTRSRPRTH